MGGRNTTEAQGRKKTWMPAFAGMTAELLRRPGHTRSSCPVRPEAGTGYPRLGSGDGRSEHHRGTGKEEDVDARVRGHDGGVVEAPGARSLVMPGPAGGRNRISTTWFW